MQFYIETQRLLITEFDESMAEIVHLNSLDDDNRRFVPDEVFETIEAARSAITALIANYSRADAALVYPVALKGGQVIGHVQAVPLKDGWEIGYHIAKEFAGNGYATEAVSAFLPQIIEKLGVKKMLGVCLADNFASRKVLEKCRFKLEFEGMAKYQGAEREIARYIFKKPTPLEKMDEFFNLRADIYDGHMLDDLGLDEFYCAIADCFPAGVSHLLDLGCGTGLELERLFKRFPNMEVTGVDMSANMLKILERKFPGTKLRLICGSYFTEDFGGGYDAALSTYSLHHFSEEEKLALYIKLAAAMMPEGVFVLGDYTVGTIERQRELLAANEQKRRDQGIADGEFYHFDTPFTAETEISLLLAAGFSSAKILRSWESTAIIVAER